MVPGEEENPYFGITTTKRRRSESGVTRSRLTVSDAEAWEETSGQTRSHQEDGLHSPRPRELQLILLFGGEACVARLPLSLLSYRHLLLVKPV